MKLNTQTIYKWIFILVASTLSIIVLLSFTSCSDAKQAQKGYNKFIKHGGKIESVKVPVIIRDTLHIKGKDSIVERTFFIDCPQAQPPKTIRETKIEYRYLRNIQKDSLKYALRQLEERNDFLMDSLENDKKVREINRKQQRTQIKHTTKQLRIEEVNFKWYHYLLLVVAFVLGAYLRGVIASLFYVIKK